MATDLPKRDDMSLGLLFGSLEW